MHNKSNNEDFLFMTILRYLKLLTFIWNTYSIIQQSQTMINISKTTCYQNGK